MEIMKLLLIEDDEKISSFIIKRMSAADFLVEHINNGDQGLSMALTIKYDAAIIDIMLPGHSGL